MATSDDELRKFAKKKLKAKQDFRSLVFVWIFVFALTTAIYFLVMPGTYFWPVWPAFGIGIAVLVTGYEAYGKGLQRPITDEDIDNEIKRLKSQP